jgi:beta-fructofuranosidase
MTEQDERDDAPTVSGVPRARPSVHFTAADGWINDPYGVSWDGERYHLFYQALPGRVTWAPNCRWGHAISTDLVHWVEQPLALVPADFEVGCWSGSVVCDAGATIILYTRVAGDDWGRGQVALARRGNGTEQWTSAVSDVVIAGPPPDLGAHSFRDPYVWSTDDGWAMLVGAGLDDGSGAALQYSSVDLLNWTYDGVLCSRAATGTDGAWTGALWECPQLIRVEEQWVLLVSVWDAEVLHYVAAAIGDYDGRRFTPHRWQRLTYGQSAYAATAFTDKDGRPTVICWLREEPQNNPQLLGWAGMHSAAAVITKTADDLLVLSPHPDLAGALPPERRGGATPLVHEDEQQAQVYVLEPGGASTLEIGDARGNRATVTTHGAEPVHVTRPGAPTEFLPSALGPTRVLVDADAIEVFTPASYGAYRIEPHRH